jgi:hypothetical protein
MRSTLSIKAATTVLTAFGFAFAVGTFMFSQPLTSAHADAAACVVQPTQSVDSATGLNVVTASLSESCSPLDVNLVGVAADGTSTTLTTSSATVTAPAEFRFGPVAEQYTKYNFVIASTGQVIDTVLGSK